MTNAGNAVDVRIPPIKEQIDAVNKGFGELAKKSWNDLDTPVQVNGLKVTGIAIGHNTGHNFDPGK